MDPGDGITEDTIYNIWMRTGMWSFNAVRPQSGALFVIMQQQNWCNDFQLYSTWAKKHKTGLVLS